MFLIRLSEQPHRETPPRPRPCSIFSHLMKTVTKLTLGSSGRSTHMRCAIAIYARMSLCRPRLLRIRLILLGRLCCSAAHSSRRTLVGFPTCSIMARKASSTDRAPRICSPGTSSDCLTMILWLWNSPVLRVNVHPRLMIGMPISLHCFASMNRFLQVEGLSRE